jgi:hypothetical protein
MHGPAREDHHERGHPVGPDEFARDFASVKWLIDGYRLAVALLLISGRQLG